MSEGHSSGTHAGDRSPGDEHPSDTDSAGGIRGYFIGYALAVGLTCASFYVASGHSFIWSPGIPIALAALAIAQMGVHLVFFFHLTSARENTNNMLALAFGILVVFLVIAGSIWIMSNLDHGSPSMEEMLRQQR